MFAEIETLSENAKVLIDSLHSENSLLLAKSELEQRMGEVVRKIEGLYSVEKQDLLKSVECYTDLLSSNRYEALHAPTVQKLCSVIDTLHSVKESIKRDEFEDARDELVELAEDTEIKGEGCSSYFFPFREPELFGIEELNALIAKTRTLVGEDDEQEPGEGETPSKRLCVVAA